MDPVETPAVEPEPTAPAEPDAPAAKPAPKDEPDPRITKANAEAARYRTERNELAKRLKEIEDADKSEIEKAAERLAELEKRADTAERALLRRNAADEAGLAPEFADRLTGDTAEELREDAARFAELVKGNRPDPKPTDGLPGDVPRGAQPRGDAPLSMDEAKRLAKDNPAEFNRRFDAGQIPASALGA